jgi:MFS transporter, FHS family, L-fucose permease
MAMAFVAVLALRVEEARDPAPPGLGGSLALLGTPAVAFAVAGIFLYVGAEVCLARFLQPTLSGLGLPQDRAALFGPTLFFAGLTLGRLLAIAGGAVIPLAMGKLLDQGLGSSSYAVPAVCFAYLVALALRTAA